MQNWFKSGNLILIGGGLMLLFIFSLFAGFIRQDLTLVTRDYYGQELRYDQKKLAIFHALQIDSLLTLTRSGDSLELNIPVTLSSRLTKGQAYFYCPSGEDGDRSVILSPSSTGRYRMAPVLRPQCAYTVQLFLSEGEKEFYKEFKL